MGAYIRNALVTMLSYKAIFDTPYTFYSSSISPYPSSQKTLNSLKSASGLNIVRGNSEDVLSRSRLVVTSRPRVLRHEKWLKARKMCSTLLNQNGMYICRRKCMRTQMRRWVENRFFFRDKTCTRPTELKNHLLVKK